MIIPCKDSGSCFPADLSAGNGRCYDAGYWEIKMKDWADGRWFSKTTRYTLYALTWVYIKTKIVMSYITSPNQKAVEDVDS